MAKSELIVRRRKIFVILLSILLALFCFRVLAQLIQLYAALPFLPPFDTWQSGALAYPVLLTWQLLIIAVYTGLLWRVADVNFPPSRKQGSVFLFIGVIYFLIMATRLLIGVTGLSTRHWFHSYLPTTFHFVLSAFLMLLGVFHLQGARKNP